MLTIQEVNRAIMLQTWTNTELSSMIDAVKWNREHLARQIKRSISIGDNVQFVNSQGLTVTGFVEKVAIKRVTVKTINGLWIVPANMLTLIADERAYA